MKPVRLWIYKTIIPYLPETRFFGLKVRFLRWCGAEIGENVRISSSAVFLGDGDLIIKDDVWIGARCHISPVGDAVITIEAHCDLGPEVMIITGGHEIDPNGCHIGGKGFNSSVSIGEGSWLGARATILPGVILPSKTLVAAGAVVVTSPEREMLLIAGVPASEKKDLHQLIK